MLNGDADGRRSGAGPEIAAEPWVQLVTRIPKRVHRELKIHCVEAEVPLMRFVAEAVRDKLARVTREPREE